MRAGSRILPGMVKQQVPGKGASAEGWVGPVGMQSWALLGALGTLGLCWVLALEPLELSGFWLLLQHNVLSSALGKAKSRSIHG